MALFIIQQIISFYILMIHMFYVLGLNRDNVEFFKVFFLNVCFSLCGNFC